MERIVTAENVRQFAYVNDGVCKLPLKGIALSFLGLGNTSMFASDTVAGEFFGENGILFVVPYTNPWAWMSEQTVQFVDEIVDVLKEKFHLQNLPVVSTGESMGGQASLVYCVYSKHKPVACVANCPVCDMVFHYDERDDLPRTMYSALWNFNGSLQDALKSVSPLHLVDKMPRIRYHVFHCEKDVPVKIDVHSDVFVKAMREKGFDVTYNVIANRGHCDIGYPMRKLFARYVISAMETFGK